MARSLSSIFINEILLVHIEHAKEYEISGKVFGVLEN